MMFKVVILDFDGVILESLDVKKNAFLKVYEDYPEHAETIARYHLQNGGVSRYKKFVHINENILRIPINESIVNELASIFSKAVVDEMLKCPYVEGARDFLNKNSKSRRLYVASGTPEEELHLIVKKCGLDQYFSGVYGTPPTKAEIIKRIMLDESIAKNEVVFVGDALSDYEGAKETDVPFIARINMSIPDNPFLAMDVRSVNDLKELDEMLERGL